MNKYSSLPNQGQPGFLKIRKLTIAALLLAILILFSFTPLGFIRIGATALTIIHIPVIIGGIMLGPVYGGFLGLAFGLSSVLNATFAPDPTSFAFSPFVTVGGVSGNGWSLLVAILPRILTGIVPYFVYRGLRYLLKKKYTDLIAHILIIATFLVFTGFKLYLLIKGDRPEAQTSLLFDFLVYLSILTYIVGDSISKGFKFRKKDTMPLALAAVAGSLTNTALVLTFMGVFFSKPLSGIMGTLPGLLYKSLLVIVGANGVPEAVVATLITVVVVKAAAKSLKGGFE